MDCHSTPIGPHNDRTALLVSSVLLSLTMMPGLPRGDEPGLLAHGTVTLRDAVLCYASRLSTGLGARRSSTHEHDEARPWLATY